MAGNPPIVGTAIAGWRYAFSALVKMPVVFAAGMVLLFVLDLALFPFEPKSQEADLAWSGQVLHSVSALLQGFIVTPIAIAVHRFVLLGEIADRYHLGVREPRFVRFFLFTIVFQISLTVPLVLSIAAAHAEGDTGLALFHIALVALVLAAMIVLRTLILFPAIAIGAADASWINAMADTHGHTWRVLFIVILTIVPFLLILVLFDFVLEPYARDWKTGIGMAFCNAISGVFLLSVYAAVGSKLFTAYATRLSGRVLSQEPNVAGHA
jgi:hypothetical protein